MLEARICNPYIIVFKMVTGTLYGPEDLLALIFPMKVQISSEVTGDKKIYPG